MYCIVLYVTTWVENLIDLVNEKCRCTDIDRIKFIGIRLFGTSSDNTRAKYLKIKKTLIVPRKYH